MKSILVLGGTKFLGRTLVQSAINQGHRVELFHNSPSPLFPELVHHPGDRNSDLSALEGRVYDWIIDVSGQRPIFNAVGPVRPFGDFLDCCQAITDNRSPRIQISQQQIEQLELSPWKDFPMWLPPEGDHKGFVQFSNLKSVASGLRYAELETTLKDIVAWRQTIEAPLKCGLSQMQEKRFSFSPSFKSDPCA